MSETATLPSASLSLPVELTSFVGRRAERSQIRAHLSESRLVTITGFGGIGKTRLALRVATDLRRAFPDGAFFVSLGGKDDPEWLPHDISTQLGLQGRSTRGATAALIDYLAPRNMLVVLDNAEHIIDAVATLTDNLLRSCPQLRVIVTSREPLRIQGECVHQLVPLTTPPRDLSSAEPLQGFESVALLVDRARMVQADFQIDSGNREAVAELSRALEGIPLAIELAVGRLRAQSPAEILRGLEGQWESLNRGSRTAPDRQRTMTGCIEWSFDLCTEEERAFWARAAVFTEGFELDAACRVLETPEQDCLGVLLSLVDKSIVTTSETHGRTRYRMLPPIRQRGLARLEELGELTAMRGRHLDWAVDLVQQAAEEWVSPKQLEWLHRMRAERPNLESALEFCISQPGQAAKGLLMGASVLEFGLADGVFRPGRVWFDQLLPLAPEPDATRALALRTACWWATMQGDLQRARPLMEEGLRIARAAGGDILPFLTQAEAFVAMFSGETDLAHELYEQALAGFRAQDEVTQEAHTLTLIALNHTFGGRTDQALDTHAECMQILEPAGESWFRGHSTWIAGLAHWLRGDRPGGTALQKESLRLRRSLSDRLGIGLSLEALAWADVEDEPRHAAVLMGAAQNEWDLIETSPKALPGLAALHDAAVEALRRGLGGDGYAVAFEEGRALDQQTAVRLALGEQDASSSSDSGRSSGGSSSRGATSALTRREREIAGLVQQGLSNKEIAESLVISKRTAETHVEHILTKLGFTNRNQIAAWAGEQNLGDTPSASRD
jgi:serine/threonine-protein kinase PknK